MEAARGHFVYANLWSKRAAEAFDLAAAVLIVRQAGGDACDLDGEPIDGFASLANALDGREPGERVTLSVRRDDETVEIEIHLQELGR